MGYSGPGSIDYIEAENAELKHRIEIYKEERDLARAANKKLKQEIILLKRQFMLGD